MGKERIEGRLNTSCRIGSLPPVCGSGTGQLSWTKKYVMGESSIIL